MPSGFSQPPVAFFAQYFDPMSSPGFELRVLLVLPCPRDIFKSTNLLEPPKLLLSRLGKEFTTSPLADQAVDFSHEGFRNDDVCAPRAHT